MSKNDERRFDRGAWLIVAVVMGWFIFAISASLAASQLPSDGWSSIRSGPRGTYVVGVPLTNVPSPLRADDMIMAVNGRSLTPDTLPLLPTSLQVGQKVGYTIQRGEQTLDVEVTLQQAGTASLLYGLVRRLQENPRDMIVSLVSFLVIAFAFLARPHNLGARYLLLIFGFYFVVQWFGFATSEVYMSRYPGLWLATIMLGGSWSWYFFPSLTLMPLAFPVVKRPLRRFPHLLPALLYGIPFTLILGCGIYMVNTGDLGLFNSFLFLLVFFVPLGLTVISLFGTLIHNWFTLREPATRAQLRWVTLGLGVGLGLPFAGLLGGFLIFGEVRSGGDYVLWLIMLLPISLAVAITRYRLFDIDVIIRKTLQYSVLTGLLGLVYFGSVVLLQELFFGSQTSEIAIVLSTLLIAGLFNPLRRGIQDFIDRRFYRKKYDPAQVLADFTQTCQNETDMEALTAELLHIIQETMQPGTITLWLKPSNDGRPTITPRQQENP